MADKDITIAITTTGDTTGAAAVEKSIFKVEDAAKTAERELDVLEAKRRAQSRSGGLSTDLTGAVKEGHLEGAAKGLGYSKELEFAKRTATAMGVEVTPVIAADALAIGGSFASIAFAAKKSYEMVAGTVDGYKDLFEEIKKSGQTVDPELELQVQALTETLDTLRTPFNDIAEYVGKKWGDIKKIVTSPMDFFSGLGDLKEALANADKQKKALLESDRELVSINQKEISVVYDRELAQLKEQEETVKRMTSLRNAMGAQANETARIGVESAKLRGGDVDFATANALATELATGLAKLSDNMVAAQQKARVAEENFSKLSSQYNKAMDDKMNVADPKQFTKLQEAYVTAQKAVSDAAQLAADQGALYEGAKKNLFLSAENSLAKLETDTSIEITKAGKKVRDQLYQTIKTGLTEAPTAAIAQINVASGTITSAATTKAGEVQAAIAQERTSTVQAIQVLAPLPENTAAVTAAIAGVKTAIDSKDAAIIGALDAVASGIGVIAGRITQQQNQINQLFARIR